MTAESERPLTRTCAFCGRINGLKLGECHVCHLPVCEYCGNTQHSRGVRTVVHNACLGKGDDHGFKMIRIVK